jgi:hypothetical protein
MCQVRSMVDMTSGGSSVLVTARQYVRSYHYFVLHSYDCAAVCRVLSLF